MQNIVIDNSGLVHLRLISFVRTSSALDLKNAWIKDDGIKLHGSGFKLVGR
jgi:hypothetical protein